MDAGRLDIGPNKYTIEVNWMTKIKKQIKSKYD